jgi:hypothetical protein
VDEAVEVNAERIGLKRSVVLLDLLVLAQQAGYVIRNTHTLLPAPA